MRQSDVSYFAMVDDHVVCVVPLAPLLPPVYCVREQDDGGLAGGGEESHSATAWDHFEVAARQQEDVLLRLATVNVELGLAAAAAAAAVQQHSVAAFLHLLQLAGH
jgi:hypothetical protein